MTDAEIYRDLLEAKIAMNVVYRDDVSLYVRMKVQRAQKYLDEQASVIAAKWLAEDSDAAQAADTH